MSPRVDSTLASASSIRSSPWESPLEQMDGGMIPKSIAHTSLVLSLSCSDVLSCLVPLCLWISFLFCTQVCPSHELHFFVLRDTDQTIPLHESFQTHIAVEVIYLCSNSGTSLSGSTVSLLLLSFTLNQASASTNHSIVPSRGNGKFTCLG